MRTRRRRRSLALRAADLLAVAALVTAIAVIGVRLSSGDGATQRPPRSAATPTASATATSIPASPGRGDCRTKGITRNRGTGSCMLPDGTQIKAVHHGSELALDEMDVAYAGSRVTSSLRVGGDRLEPTGVYVVITLRVTNELPDPVNLETDRIALIVGKRVFPPDLYAAALLRSSLFERVAGLQSGRSATGNLVFDVPEEAAGELGTNGTIRIFQFTDSPDQPGEKAVGFIRIDR